MLLYWQSVGREQKLFVDLVGIAVARAIGAGIVRGLHIEAGAVEVFGEHVPGIVVRGAATLLDDVLL